MYIQNKGIIIIVIIIIIIIIIIITILQYNEFICCSIYNKCGRRLQSMVF